MNTYVLRLWLPDRPGALGLVATRIGAVRGDVLSIEIIERDGGQAVDELIVGLPDPELVPLMLSEIAEVDGVAVEDVWPVLAGRATRDAQLLDLVESLVQVDVDKRLQVLCDGLQTALDTDWAVAFLAGARYMPSSEPAPDDVAWASAGGLTIAGGRQRWSLRASERAHVKQLARIASSLT